MFHRRRASLRAIHRVWSSVVAVACLVLISATPMLASRHAASPAGQTCRRGGKGVKLQARGRAGQTATRRAGLPTAHALIVFPPYLNTAPRFQAHFLGLSIELQHLCYLLSTEQRNAAIVNLLRGLDLGNMRIGGTSQDRAVWKPKGRVSCGLSTTIAKA